MSDWKKRARPVEAPPVSVGGEVPQDWRARAKPSEAPPDISSGRAGTLGFAQGGTFGFADEIGGAIGRLLLPAPVTLGEGAQPSADDTPEVRAAKAESLAAQDARRSTYESTRDAMRTELHQAEEQQPGAVLAGQLLGAAATVPLVPGGQVRAGGAVARLLPRAAAGARAGAAQGLVGGIGGSEAEVTRGDAGGLARDATIGAVTGGVIGGALPVAGEGVRRAVRGIVRPDEAAAVLRSRGVPLTLGQMRPGGVINQLEETATSLSGVGPPIAAQREASREAWRTAVLNEARAPGGPKLDTTRSAQERLDDAYQGFREAYAIPKAAEMRPETAAGLPLAEAFARGIDDPAAMATESTQNVVSRFLDDQLTLLPQARTAMAGDRVPAEVLLRMRSSIRDAARDANRAGDVPRLRILENAEAEVTDALESQMPEWASDALRATDARYSTYKLVEDAVGRAGDSPAGFSPYHLQQSVRASTEKGAFARGAGGELRQLANAGRAALDTRAPQTGARLLAMPPGVGHVVGLLNYMGNLPAGQRVALGETGAQRGLQSLADSPTGQLLADVLRGRGGALPATAGQNAPPETTPEAQRARALAEALRRLREGTTAAPP